MGNLKAVTRLGVVLVIYAAVAGAQTTQGLIAGRLVNSQTGAPVGGAQVSYSNAATGSSGVATSDGRGNFFLPMLSPGQYRIRATAAGFQSREVQELELPVAARLELNFQLRPLSDVWESGQYRSVFLPGTKTIVTFYGPDVDSSRSGSFEATQGRRGALESTVSSVIDPAQVRDLPLAGRDVYTMLVTQPGVTADTATARGLGLSINGQRPSSSNFMLDGLENNNYLVTGPLTPIAPEAIQEYRVSTNNFSAEYGRTAGFLANAVTRSGGNQFHGIGYFYLKNDALNANGFQENLAGLPRTPVKENQIGFQAGGPIRKQSLFFSTAYEHLRSRGRQGASDFYLPSTLFRQQLSSAPADRLAKKLIDQFPGPVVVNNSAFSGRAVITPPVSVDRTLAIERVDYNSRNGLNRVMGRVAIARLSRPDFIWSPYRDFISSLDQDTWSVAVSYVRALRPGLMNEAKLGRSNDDLGWDRPHPEIPTLSATESVIFPDGSRGPVSVSLPGSPAFYAYRNRNKTWELLDSLVWTHGRHLFTAGGGVLLRSSDGFLTAGQDGEYAFRGLFDFILDRPSALRTSVLRQPLPNLQAPNFNREYRYNQYFLFAQDTFKATSRLALNYGVRYEQYGAPRNTGAVKDTTVNLGRGANFGERLATAQLVYPGAGDQELYNPDKNDWAGRFGFSYDLLGNARTLLRGAYGIFYDRPYDNLWQNLRTNNFVLPTFAYPSNTTVNYLTPVVEQLKNFNGRFLNTSFPNLTLYDQDSRNAYVQSYFLGVQRQVTDNWTIEVNVLGSLGRKLIVSDIVNRPYSDGFFRFNENLDNITYRTGQGLSNYHALTAVARYRAGRKQFQLAYTWSHAIDEQSEPLARDFFDLLFTKIGGDTSRTEFAAFSRQFDTRIDRGNSDFDQRHNLVFFSIWDLPTPFSGTKAATLLRDWRFSQLAAFRSGFPYSVRAPIGFDPNNPISLYNARADILDPNRADLDTPVSGGKLLLNRAAFAQAPASRQGNTGRNAFRGPGLYNIDISLSRSFPVSRIGEAGRLTFRADVFNLLNHANLNNPQPLINQPDFGVAPYGRQGKQSGFPAVSPFNETARQVQLILRLEF